jgi:mannose-6-phosphate isomerase-like protein (cupin superfamily)
MRNKLIPFVLVALTVSLATPALAQDAPAGKMTVIDGEAVKRDEPPPHGNIGMSTAYRYSDAVPGRAMEFRQRVLHVGAAIGAHKLAHDEVYYVLSGEGDAFSGDRTESVKAGQAIYFFAGETMGIRQKGAKPLALIISYPLAVRSK